MASRTVLLRVTPHLETSCRRLRGKDEREVWQYHCFASATLHSTETVLPLMNIVTATCDITLYLHYQQKKNYHPSERRGHTDAQLSQDVNAKCYN